MIIKVSKKDEGCSPYPNEIDEKHLLAEYQANIDLWKHDDMLRQERDKKFLTINTMLFVALGVMFQFGGKNSETLSTNQFAIAMMVFSLIGIIICTIWNVVLSRNEEYIKFRKMQLRAIECQLKSMNTFLRTHIALDDDKPIHFETGDLYTGNKNKRSSFTSTATEGKLPILITLIWILLSILGIIILIY